VVTRRPIPASVANWIGGEERAASGGRVFVKQSPHDGERLCEVARSGGEEVDAAVAAARRAQPGWADLPGVSRGEILFAICRRLEDDAEEMAETVALETGKSPREALGETRGAIQLGRFFAGEGQRLYGRTTTSGTPNRHAFTVRRPCGVAGLIAAANTPIANAAWKIFPALICGNGVVFKAPEDAPATGWRFGKLASEAGLPAGVLNVVQGYGVEAGAPLVEHAGVDVLSFTGSTAVGRWIAEAAGRRLAKVSLELGGKNPFVICDDADLDAAVRWASLSAFSNAGQRCAAGSRILVFAGVYDRVRDRLVEKARSLRVGPRDEDDLGPVIHERQLARILDAIDGAKRRGARVLTGGDRLRGPSHARGCYLEPTLLEGVDPSDELSACELFGPVACLYRVADFAEALALANASPYGLTACIHTRSLDRAVRFCEQVQAGVAMVNAGTFGSEPHMPFGGVKHSGNGSREPGTEALDVYSELRDVYVSIDPERV
jgi:alpha-ketoglutaric semialdehyde dehydrogenase